MAWQKSPPDLVQRFDRAVPDDGAIQKRKMFGYPAAFLGGRLFASLYREEVVLKLSEKDRSAFLKLPGCRPFEPRPGRVMGDFVLMPAALAADAAALKRWIARAHGHAASLPAKTAKKKPAKKKPTAA